jgi:hypothetical protein
MGVFMKKFLKLFLVLLTCTMVLSGCSNKEEYTVSDKNIEELEYIENNLINIVGKIINNEYITDDIFDWNLLLSDTRKVESVIPIVELDLVSLNITSDEISKLSNGINNMIIAIDKKDEKTYLIELNNVYALIPTYMEKYAKDEDEVFKQKLKYYTISTYIAYFDDNLDMAKAQVSELDTIYNEKMQSLEYVQNNEYNLNKIYILIQEYKQAIESDSSELIKSKYLLLIDEI